MITILLSSLLFIIGLIYFLSTIPPTKKLLLLWHQFFYVRKSYNKPPQDPSTVSAGAERRDLRSLFSTFDKDGDGFITRAELKMSLQNIGISAEEKDVTDMVEKLDSNGDGLIDFIEFCELFGSISSREDKRYDDDDDDDDGELREAFEVFDGNKDGLITVEELGLVLSSMGFSEGKKMEDCEEMIKKVDVDGDGMVNLEEFKRMMRNGKE